MADFSASNMSNESEVDFSLNGDEEISNIKEVSTLENSEIDIFDEIPDEDFVLADENFIEAELKSIPIPEVVPVFVDEKDIPIVVTHKSTPGKTFNCMSCGKIYKKNRFYVAHIQYCGRNLDEEDENTDIEKTQQEKKQSRTIKQQKKNIEDSIAATDHENLLENDKILIAALHKSMEDPFNKMLVGDLHTPGNKVAALSAKLIGLSEENYEPFIPIANEIGNVVLGIFDGTNFMIPSSRENMWIELITHIKFDLEETSFYGKALEYDNDESIVGSLYYCICMYFLHEYTRKRNIERLEIPIIPESITMQEKQVIHYVGGYILFTLSRHYKSINRRKGDIVSYSVYTFLSSLKRTEEDISGDSFMDFITKWTKSVSRGYLTETTTEMFDFVLAIEEICRRVLNIDFIKRNKHCDLRDTIEEKLLSNQQIQNKWLTLTRNLNNDEIVNFLKKQIIRKWIDIRAYAFVNTYIQLLKQQIRDKKASKTLSSSSQPGLRKLLHT